jgi:hypothetical protein
MISSTAFGAANTRARRINARYTWSIVEAGAKTPAIEGMINFRLATRDWRVVERRNKRVAHGCLHQLHTPPGAERLPDKAIHIEGRDRALSRGFGQTTTTNRIGQLHQDGDGVCQATNHLAPGDRRSAGRLDGCNKPMARRNPPE